MGKRIRIFLIFVLFVLIFISSIYLFGCVNSRLDINGSNGYYLYDSDGKLYSGKDFISLSDISPYLVKATISSEDKHFYRHLGFDPLRIFKALCTNIRESGNVQGASTISQQLSKNMFLNFDKTYSRKIREAYLTIRLETHYRKDDILASYLNSINYGGIFGIKRASDFYFGKDPSSLSLAEASILAGIPKNPSKYSPLVNFDNAKRRQRVILDLMVKNGDISSSLADKAYSEKLSFRGKLDDNESDMIGYYRDAVMDELSSISSLKSFNSGGIRIYTNLDRNALDIMEKSVNDNIKNDSIEFAGVLMDPKSGKVLALSGGRSYKRSEFNRAIRSKRQVGSSIKPFLYYGALENGFTPSTTFTSERTTFTYDGKTYTPKNYNDRYPDGPISLAAAISYSDNIYAVKSHLFLGSSVLPSILKRVGIDYNFSSVPSLALGTKEISLIDMMAGYESLASMGYRVKPYFISRVTDMDGNVLYEHRDSSISVLNRSNVFILSELLTSTYDKRFIDYNVPTCLSMLPKMSHKYALKSGTTNTDNWIFGYNNNLVLGLWSGYDEGKRVNNSDSSSLKNAWIDIAEGYLKGSKDDWYDIPSNVVLASIDPISGKISNGPKARGFYFLRGTIPGDESLDDVIPTVKGN